MNVIKVITIAILLNGEVLTARSCRRIGKYKIGKNKYKVDDGSVIWHNPQDGAVVLAKKLLETIKE